MYRIEYQPQLMEEAVLRAIAGHHDELLFRKERDRVYKLADLDTREEAFQSLHQQWYERLRLAAPLEEALALWPILKSETQKCVLSQATSAKEIGAELFVAQTQPGSPLREQRVLVIRLTPELLTQPQNLLPFLRHELMHIVDMIEPDFGYKPELPKSDIGATYDRLLRERYRVLWDITIDGRLVQQSWLNPEAKSRHWLNFKQAFSGPEADLENIFSFFFNNQRPNHAELVSFAQSSESWFINTLPDPHPKGLCSVCQFPSFHLEKTITKLSPQTIIRIQDDIPGWQPEQLICQQCADVYESQNLQLILP